MKVSYNWLSEYFEEKLPSPEEVVDLLTMKAFEIEGLEKVSTDTGEDFVIDVDVLPNRAHDCLSHDGIAREISAITGLEIKSKNSVEKALDFKSDFKIKVSNDACLRYVACEVKNLVIGDSPAELKARLQALGQKSINILVDITNIVMFETGQPMHAFDTDKMEGQEINVEMALEGEKITTLDKKLVELDPEILLIKDAKYPLAIAGIKGGKTAEVNMASKNIILESANFNPVAVRKNARRIGIATESSKRFENEITPELAMKAMGLAIDLISKYAATEKTLVSDKIDHYPKKWRHYKTGVSLGEINSLLGADFTEKEVAETFSKLRFDYEIVNPREKISEEIQDLLDRPYKYGASVFFDSPERFDCSSFVSYAYSLAGYSIPRMAVDQFAYSQRIIESELLPGDLIFANTGVQDKKIDYKTVEFMAGTKISHGVDHVGIYIGDGKVIHATQLNDAGVIEEIIEQSERFKNTVGYGRIIKQIKDKPEGRFAVTVPVERLDIKTGPDLIEEVGRMIGYEKITPQPVSEKIQKSEFTPKPNSSYQLSNLLKYIATAEGFSEIISYTFNGEGSLEPLKPIAEDKGYVRESLLPGMEAALQKNLNNADLLGLETIKLFELGKVFKKVKKDDLEFLKNNPEKTNHNSITTQFLDSDYIINESLVFSLGVRNKQGVKNPKPGDVLKNVLEIVGSVMGVNLIQKFDLKILPGTEKVELSLCVLLSDLEVIENLKNVINKYENDKKVAGIYPALPKIPTDTKYKPISQYPFMLRDIAVWVPINNDEAQVLKLIQENCDELLVNYKLFDIYKKDDKVSFAYHLVFQSQDKTLTDDEANIIMDRINSKMIEKGWEVR